MRRLQKGFAAFTLAAAATLGGLAAAAPAQANSHDGLVNVYVVDVLSGNQVVLLQNVPINVAANVCGDSVNVLSNQLASSDKAQCSNKTTNLTKGWVVWS